MEKLIDIRVRELITGSQELVIQLDGGGASITLERGLQAEGVVRKLHQLAELIERSVQGRVLRVKAPWPDFAGNEIYEGDVIQHPNGMRGTVLYMPIGGDEGDSWLVDYGDVSNSRLILQIGDKGRAVVAFTGKVLDRAIDAFNSRVPAQKLSR